MAGKNTEHIQLLDGFRGIAILAVFLFHCLGASFGYDHLAWGRWFSDFSAPWSFLVLLPCTLGWAGVAVFFVVSGFCIHLSFLKGPANDWRGFFARRFFRIYPPYLLALVFFACIFAPTRLGFHSRNDWGQLGSHALLLHNLDYRFFYGVDAAFWSIAVEVQLYLIYPLLLAMVRKTGWQRTLLALGLLETLMRAASSAVETSTGNPIWCWFSASPFGFWFSWAIGAALADAYVQKRPLPFRRAPLVPVCAMAVATAFIRPLNALSFLFFALFTAMVLARLLASERPLSLQSWAAVHLRNLGIYSYSFYLLHQPLVFAWGRFLGRFQTVAHHRLLAFALCAGAYPLIYLVSWLYYRTLEVRSIAMGKRVLGRLRPTAAPAPL
jgi:peptidoglycan/LPS O-acetylase OafA/YrhL